MSSTAPFDRRVLLFAACLFAYATQQSTALGEGSLLIAGGSSLPDEVRSRFIELAGGAAEARLIVLPTASIYADDPEEEDWFLEPWRDRGVEHVELVHTRDRAVADTGDFAEAFRSATAVWISGGDQRRLIAAYADTAVERELFALLERGGVVGGTSAGAAVMSNPMIEGGREVAEVGRGFGFLPSVLVDQHFVARNRIVRLRNALERHPSFAGLGIDESTAAVVDGGVVSVIGESTVTAILPTTAKTPGREIVLEAGDSIDLATLRATESAQDAEHEQPEPAIAE